MAESIAKFEDGKLWILNAGQYAEDPFGLDCTFRLMNLKSLPEEYRTQQDIRHLNELQTALKARRADEEEK